MTFVDSFPMTRESPAGAGATDPPACAPDDAGDVAGTIVRLGEDEGLVPSSVMTPAFREDTPGLLRDLAALLLDRHLRRLARMRNPVDLRLGRLLARLDGMAGPLALGFARLADYAAERLGLPARRARDLVALGRGLEPLPGLAAAFEAGEVSRSQVRLLLRVATAGNEESWIARARGGTVRRLDHEVREALVAGREPAPPGEALREEGEAGEDAPAGAWVEHSVPAHLGPVWDRALELARRASGAPDPAWACAEMIAADFLAGVPDLASLLARELGADATACDGGGEPGRGVRPAGDRDDQACTRDETDLFEEVLGALEADSGVARWAPPLEGLGVLLPDSTRPRPDDTPRVIDRRLRELVRLRQNIAWHQGRLLRILAGRRLYRELGFLSFARYTAERAGLGVRRAWELVGLERRLWLLPRLTDAYRSGQVSWVRAAAIARVATEYNEAAWLQLARSVTVRRLEQEVALALRHEEARLAAPSVGTLPVGLARPTGIDVDGRVQLLAPVARTADHRVQMSAHPDGRIRLRFWAPLEVASLWRLATRMARALLAEADATSDPPTEAQAVERLLTAFLAAWGVRTTDAWRRHHRIFERDGWRCRVPGCSSRRNLQVHHVLFRSQGGGDEDTNLAVLCAAHHLQGIHQGRLRCHVVPGGLLAWEFAPDDAEGPLARFVEDVDWAAARAAVASVA